DAGGASLDDTGSEFAGTIGGDLEGGVPLGEVAGDLGFGRLGGDARASVVAIDRVERERAGADVAGVGLIEVFEDGDGGVVDVLLGGGGGGFAGLDHDTEAGEGGRDADGFLAADGEDARIGFGRVGGEGGGGEAEGGEDGKATGE